MVEIETYKTLQTKAVWTKSQSKTSNIFTFSYHFSRRTSSKVSFLIHFPSLFSSYYIISRARTTLSRRIKTTLDKKRGTMLLSSFLFFFKQREAALFGVFCYTHQFFNRGKAIKDLTPAILTQCSHAFFHRSLADFSGRATANNH